MQNFVSIMSRLLGLSLFLISIGANAQSESDTTKAFLRLQAKIETGITVREYSTELGNVRFEFKMYQESDDASSHAEAIAEYQKALALYDEANQLWALKFGRYGMNRITKTAPMAKQYIDRYPSIDKDAANGGALILDQIEIDYLLQVIWRDAATHVDTARATLVKKRKENNAPNTTKKLKSKS